MKKLFSILFLSLIVSVTVWAELNPTQLKILKTEITNDPKLLGYMKKSDKQVADLINSVGLSGEKVDATYGGVTISVDDLLSCYYDLSEYDSLTLEQKTTIDRYVDLAAMSGGLDINKFLPMLRLILEAEFTSKGNVPVTSQNLLALTYREATRAEVLGLPKIIDVDVKRANKLP